MGKYIKALAVFLLVVPSWGRTITVDDDGEGDFWTIGDAIEQSSPGDTIVVRPGTYREQVNFDGRRITVRSENPDDPAVVKGSIITNPNVKLSASVVFNAGEREGSVLAGFTIVEYGIFCSASSPTITKNVIRNCVGMGIRGQSGAAPTITANQVLFNDQEGIYACEGLIQGNTISNNRAGIASCRGPILDNIVSENLGGGGIYSCNGEIAGNRIVGNYAALDGGGVYSCDGPIHHNIITGNRADRSGGGLYDCGGAVYNNTIFGNRAVSMGGGIYNCPQAVHNNIISYNEALQGAGIYGQSNNTYNVFWLNLNHHFGGGALPGTGDVVVDPLFLAPGHWDDNDTPNTSDDVWFDGDYHLKSQAGRWDPQFRQWVTDKVTSQCIDAGKPSSDWAAELWPHGKRINVGAYGGKPEASMSLASLGFPADLNHDEQVGPLDLKQLAKSWAVQEDLLAADLNRDGLVDGMDFAVLGMQWRSEPPAPTPPLPNPMTWATKPYPVPPDKIAMVATTATSTDGTGVEYYFEDFFYPDINSGWLYFGPGQDPCWVDENSQLRPETLYWYHVKARNRGNRLETAWSEREAAELPPIDSQPPQPNPMTWATPPSSVSAGTIRMVATTATDGSGVEYQFECVSHPIYSSGWQDSPTYELSSLPKGYYTFRVRARDKSLNQNATMWSNQEIVDLVPPTPDPMKWEAPPKEIQIGGGDRDYYATMTAVEASDDSASVEYYFECTTTSDTRKVWPKGFSSGWQSERTWTVQVGRKNQAHTFRVRARDKWGNTTGWSQEWPAL